jgi:hypothetical protein
MNAAHRLNEEPSFVAADARPFICAAICESRRT